MTKIALVSMIKNECDIIELFIKINSREADLIYIIDHMSTDGTTEIITRLKTKFNQIIHKSWNHPEFQQSAVITTAVREIANLNIFDYIIPLDADEFLHSDSNEYSIREIISIHINTRQTGLIPWATYCPINDEYFKSSSPLNNNFRKRATEPRQFYKVVIGNEFAKECFVTEGSHEALNNQLQTTPQKIPIQIQHVPVRSSDQIIRKAILGSHTMSITKNNLQPNSGLHWKILAEKIRKNNYQISFEDLQDFSLNYATFSEDKPTTSLDESAPRIGLETDEIENKDLSIPNLLESFDIFISEIINKIYAQ